ncbi:MAG: DUF924 family protein [Halioglobus sp.]|nr:DUF924 family protein [Halioglobus sp.]
MDDQLIRDIHDFWFGELDAAGMPCADRNALWFGGSAATDAACRRYAPALERALAGALDHWAHSDRGLVALIVLLDQFSRNVYRSTPRAFAGDTRALALARRCIDSGRDNRLPAIHRVFVYLPLEHSEESAAQRQSVRLFDALAAGGDPRLAGFARYARAHRDVIERFGRFPHRNAILGRDSTAAERDYLDRHRGF